MKKIFSLLLVLLFVVSLSACNKEKTEEKEAKTEEWVEPTDNTSFEDFLDENVNSFDSEKLDSLFGEVEEVKPEEILDIKISNLSATLAGTGAYADLPVVGMSGVAWQEGTVIYAAATLEGETQAVKLDLADLVELADQAMEESYVKPSEAINMLLAEALGSGYDLDYFLDKVEFDLDDFNDKGNGVYELKLEAVADLVDTLSEGEVNADEALEFLEMFDTLSVSFKYSNGKIRNISAEMEANPYAAKVKASLSLDLSYGKDGVNGLAIDASFSTEPSEEHPYAAGATSVTLKANVSLEALSVKFTMESAGGEIELEAEADASKIKAEFKVVQNGKTQGVVKVDLKLADNWVTEGKVVVDQQIEGQEGKLTVTLQGGSKVSIPSIDKADAMDLMDAMMSQGGYEDVYAPEVYPY